MELMLLFCILGEMVRETLSLLELIIKSESIENEHLLINYMICLYCISFLIREKTKTTLISFIFKILLKKRFLPYFTLLFL